MLHFKRASKLVTVPLRKRYCRFQSSWQGSYDHGTSTQKLIGSTIGNFFDIQVKQHGDIDALVVKHQNVRLTYSQLGDQVDTLAQNLILEGVEPGTRFAEEEFINVIFSIRRPCWDLGTKLLRMDRITICDC